MAKFQTKPVIQQNPNFIDIDVRHIFKETQKYQPYDQDKSSFGLFSTALWQFQTVDKIPMQYIGF